MLLGLGLPTFISLCGLGGIRPSAAMRRLVSSSVGFLAMSDNLSLEPNPFRNSVYSEKGDYDSPSLARIKGYTLSEWEHAEDLLCTMFSLLVRPTGGTFVSDRAIGALFSSGGRREIILGAAEAYFSLLTHDAPDDLKKTAKELHSKIRSHIRLFGDASRRRDEIAHSVIMGTEMDENKKFLYFLLPSLYASKKFTAELAPGFDRATYRMNIKAINRMADLFGALFTRTAQINHEISIFYHALPETLRARHP